MDINQLNARIVCHIYCYFSDRTVIILLTLSEMFTISIFFTGALTPRGCGLSFGGTGFENAGRRKRDAATGTCVYRMGGVSLVVCKCNFICLQKDSIY